MKNSFIIAGITVAGVAVLVLSNSVTGGVMFKEPVALRQFPKTLGLGTLDISFNRPVPLYVSENDDKPFDTLYFEKQSNGVMLFRADSSKLKPYRKSGGDSNEDASRHIRMGLIRFPASFEFRVLEATDDFYRVVVNEESFETVVIKKDPDYALLPQRSLFGTTIPKSKKGFYIYETWEHLLLRAQYVEIDSNGADPNVYDKPDGKIIYNQKGSQEHLPYNVVEVKGDWIKVKNGSSYNDKGIKKAKGWIKWKNNDKILIDITEFTVE